MSHSSPASKVPADFLRQKFAEERILERADRGELLQELFADGHAHPRSNEPECTRSQMIVYLTHSRKPQAMAHRYLQKSGKIGGSGLPDPKRIWLSGKVYYDP